MMYLPAVKAYRTPQRGTVYWDGTWRDILSVRQTVRVARLFRFPDEVLANAYKHAPRGGKWVEPEKKDAKGSGAPAATEASSGEERPASTTAVAGSTGPAAEAAAAPERPRTIRVEAPPEEALRHIIEVQNSDCFGGG
jgi:hypothetical protein